MVRYTGLLGSAALVLSLSLAGTAVAQDVDSIDFGDDTSRWANDGRCDDPRFEGPGASTFAVSGDQQRDATDCRDAFLAGTVTLTGATSGSGGGIAGTTGGGLGGIAGTAGNGAIDYGNDSGPFANDGECDDPRFTGPGVWTLAGPDGIRADASDCRAAVEAGQATFVGEDTGGPFISSGDIDYGNDSGTYANDGECDDPRFEGPGVWIYAGEEGVRADASDCRAAVEAGQAYYAGEYTGPGLDVSVDDIDFGDDSSQWSNDGECDDGRFGGPGMGLTNMSHVRMDATDCRSAFVDGMIYYMGEGDSATVYDGIDFGDNSSMFANDGQCDDPRFAGPGVWAGANDQHAYADAADCLAAYQAGTADYIGDGSGGSASTTTGTTGNQSGATINFGNDSGIWANDGECDDARFQGAGMGVADQNHVMADATDCRNAYNAGTITLASEGSTGAGGPVVNFGNDSGALANNGVCDDPRFEGPGGASLLYPENAMADATDCRAAFNAGTVTLAP